MNIKWEELESIEEDSKDLELDGRLLISEGVELIWEYEQYSIYKENEQVGYVIMRMNPKMNTIIIDSIEVELEYRGKGIGREVYEFVISKVNPKWVVGCAKVSAVGFWNKLGAEIELESVNLPEEYLVPFKITRERKI